VKFQLSYGCKISYIQTPDMQLLFLLFCKQLCGIPGNEAITARSNVTQCYAA